MALPRGKNNGTSLVEIIVYIFIGVLIALVITEIFISQTQIGDKQSAKTDIERNSVSGINTLKTITQSAITVVASRTFGSDLFVSGSDTLILKLPAVDSSGDLVAGSSDYVVFFRDPVNPALLKITTEAGTGSARIPGTKIISSFVDSIEFGYNKSNITDSDAITITIITSTASGSETFRSTSQARINLRNKNQTP